MADYNTLFQQDSLDKQLTITSDSGVVITDSEIHENEFSLKESLCSAQQLKFGTCESSEVKFKISYTESSLFGEWLTIKTSIDGEEPFQIGRYKVKSDTPTSDRSYRDIVAYDAMHDILTTDIAEWYNTIFPGDNTRVTVKEFRDSFFEYLGVTQETVTLPQDGIYIQKTVDPIELAGSYIITSLCELNGCFGHIDRQGIFRYVFLEEITEESGFIEIAKTYQIDSSYQDYVVQPIDKIKIRQNANDEGFVYGDGENQYLIEDNMLIYGYSDEQLATIASTLMNYIGNIYYRPSTVKIKGNLTIDVGQGIKVVTRYKTIYTYVLQRTFSGVQALFDEFTASASGALYDSNLNSADKQIIQIKGLINQVDNSAFHFNVVRNGRAVGVGDGLTRRIIRANIQTKKDAQVKIEIEILLDLEITTGQTKAIGIITYALDDVLQDRTPIETWSEDGKHIMALQYYLNISEAGFHDFDVFLNMNGGSVSIAERDILEIFTGTNLVEEPGWNGNIEIEEDAPEFAITSITFEGAYDDGITIRKLAPVRITASDTAHEFVLKSVAFDHDAVDSLILIKHLEQSVRVTEDGTDRATESGDVRYTEEEE